MGKTMTGSISRRDALKLFGNIGVATFAGGGMFASRSAMAQQATAMLGHFGSANPQTFAKATGAFAKAFGANVKTDFVTVGGGPQVLAAIAGNSMDICNVGSSPMVVGFGQGIKMSMVYVEKYITDSECLAVRKDSGINTMKDLKGKKIGLPFNTSVHFAMLAGLKTVGLTASDVTLINIRPIRSRRRGSARTSTARSSGIRSWASCSPTTASCCSRPAISRRAARSSSTALSCATSSSRSTPTWCSRT
jgi:taurine transport system substrate-binding protein